MNQKLYLSVLQSLFATMHEVIYAHGGIVDKHLGDGLMAVFGLSGLKDRGPAHR